VRFCWQIRQTLFDNHSKNGGQSDATQSWVVDCAACAIFNGAQSCWEQCGGAPCCCAAIHVTCDFCVLYLEHRREITEMLQTNTATPSISGKPAYPISSVAALPTHVKGEGSATMEKLQLNVPDLWADHHVLKARAALTALPGVQDVIASSAFRMVALSYNPALASPGAIMATLEDAGYPVATDGTGVIAETVPVADGKRDPAWTRLGMRQIKTDERDLKTKR